MRSLLRHILLCATILLAALLGTGCHELDDERIPAMAVNINMDNAGVWAVFGVKGFGDSKRFILTSKERVPSDFPYTSTSATGYGGVLLIWGQNPFSGEVGPMAFDLSCPVERMPEIRVHIGENFEAICDHCGSHYNVVEQYGRPIEGPAKRDNYAMTPYQCYATINGGYLIGR